MRCAYNWVHNSGTSNVLLVLGKCIEKAHHAICGPLIKVAHMSDCTENVPWAVTM